MTRNPWIASLLSLLVPGLGQLYNGQIEKAAAFHISMWIAAAAMIALLIRVRHGIGTVLLAAFLHIIVVLGATTHAFITASELRDNFSPASYNRWYVYVGIGLIAIVVVYPVVLRTLKASALEAYKMTGDAMAPTVRSGDWFMVNKLRYGFRGLKSNKELARFRDPERRELIVFRHPERGMLLMRVVGVPGDVLMMEDGMLYVNGVSQSEHYVLERPASTDPSSHAMNWQREYLKSDIYAAEYNPSLRNWGSLVVPERKYFVLGDHRENSYDSRMWGFVDREAIIGAPLNVYFSVDPENGRVRLDRIGLELR